MPPTVLSPICIMHEIASSDEVEDVAGSVEEKKEKNLSEHLSASLQMALKEKLHGFSLHRGKALDRLVETCFGADNLCLEKKRDAHRKINLWRIFAGSVSPPTRVEILERKNSVSKKIQLETMGTTTRTPRKTRRRKTAPSAWEAT